MVQFGRGDAEVRQFRAAQTQSAAFNHLQQIALRTYPHPSRRPNNDVFRRECRTSVELARAAMGPSPTRKGERGAL